jgi:transposase
MGSHFLPCDREQRYLMPPALQDWLPEGDLAWFILDAVAQMKLAAIERTYRADGWGQAAYEPAMLVAVLLYAYCLGERSSRRIERLCERAGPVGYSRPISGPITRFRQTHEAALAALFTQVLTLCMAAGLVKGGVLALEGTTVKADAALAANRTAETIAADVTRRLTEAPDAAENRWYGPESRGDELPEVLRDRRSRRARLQACQADEAATGRKKRGRKPKAAAETTAKANVTDPESRIMTRQGGYVQGDHAQAIVTEEPIILAAAVTQEENAVNQVPSMLTQAQESLHTIEPPQAIGTALADTGYCSEANLTEADPAGPELLIAPNKDGKQRRALRGRVPTRLSRRERMERTLLTKRGRRLYTKRGQTVEPVFGQIKSARGCDRFLRRGKAACDSEWTRLCATHNLLKLWRSGKAAWLGPRGYRAQRPCGWGNGQKTRR